MLAVRLQEAEQTAESVQACVGSPEKTKQRLQTEAENLTQPGKAKKASHSRMHPAQA